MTFVVSGAQPSESQFDYLKQIEVPKGSVASLLNDLMAQFEQAKSPHYVVRRAKATVMITSSGQVGLGISFPSLLEAGARKNKETARGIEIEIEHVESPSS